ncbi:LysR family transcriptional regulator [Streptomyces cucumeris]|uniref:LysR family transcriptional regulator n=1 Tax=Streptomyces cucumeris TaxID=2962890 RepID=UPI0020C8B5D6|nr:LysR family transcriptional regulator [Streptomyces sp. NEAU-Y11]MCP9212406.1 LysR family transcriptional regulator [Streptomyces sp. NEAU-Y11]
MTLPSLDLNLVVALRALLEERNVTRAGQRIGLSQPATSAALARLRRHFDDDLLVRSGGRYELTALGFALVDRTAAACDLLDRVLASRATFDPATEEHEFTLLTSDYAVAVFGAELARVVHEAAPGVRLCFRRSPADITEDTDALLSTVDGLLMPHGIISGFPAVELFQDRWVFLVSEDHPDVDQELALSDLARFPWVSYHRAYDTPATRQLSMFGIEPQVGVSTDSFLTLPFLVAGTRRIAPMPKRLAGLLPTVAPVRMMEPPYEAVPLQEALWWHPVHMHDAAHNWLREITAQVGTAMTGPKDLADHPGQG